MAAENGNGNTLLLVLEATSYQTKNIHDISNLFAKLQHAKAPESKFQDCWVCLRTIMMVESEHYKRFMTRHVMKHAFTSNLHKINDANQRKHCCYK